MSSPVGSTENPTLELVGGVLSDGAIIDAVGNGLLIARDFNEAALHAASYDLMIAPDALITPNGQRIGVGESESQQRRVELGPGDTAMFSTKELLRLPHHIAGNISIKNRLAAEGLTLLSGLLVDPGYGLDETADDALGCRLFMHVANTGRRTIVLRPDEDRIARIQFLPLVGRTWSERKQARASRWSEQQQASLGFLSDLKHLKDSSERNRDLISSVIVGGVFVLLMTMLSVSLAVILSLSSDDKLMFAARTAVPQSSAGKWLLGALVIGLSVLALKPTVTLLSSIKRVVSDGLRSGR